MPPCHSTHNPVYYAVHPSSKAGGDQAQDHHPLASASLTHCPDFAANPIRMLPPSNTVNAALRKMSP